MGLAINIVLLLVFAAVTALIVFFVLFFSRPVATMVWLRRSALRRAGLRKTKFTTTVGEQIVWHGGNGPCWCCFMAQAIKREHGTKWRPS